MERPVTGALATRQALISAALRLFGTQGYDAVSTRQIADHAAANIGSIAYHFGGKPGLRLACADYVAEAMKEAFGTAFAHPVPAGLPPEGATDMLVSMLTNFARQTMQRPDGDDISAFIMQETIQSGEAMQHLYQQLMLPVHEKVATLFRMATGLQEGSERLSLTVFSVIGQVGYFQLFRPLLFQKLGWSTIAASEAEAVSSVLAANLRGIIQSHRQQVPEAAGQQRAFPRG